MWQANFAKTEDGLKKTTTKARIRPSMAGGMRGVDVQRVEASAVNEEKQDIEDAAVQSSVESVVDSSCKKLTELQISKSPKPPPVENDENQPKTVNIRTHYL